MWLEENNAWARPPAALAPSDIRHLQRDLVWRGHVLCFRHRKMAEINQDEKYPGMWRVRLPSGHISDIVNLSRAKDAAATLAGIANRDGFGGAPDLGLGQEQRDKRQI
jgi:hypothetical protein